LSIAVSGPPRRFPVSALFLALALSLLAPTAPVHAAGSTTRVSVSATGAQGSAASTRSTISGNGQWVAFISNASNCVPGDTNGAVDVFVTNRATRKIARVNVSTAGTQANKGNVYPNNPPSISRTGRFIAFDSAATNLVQDGIAAGGVFVRDRDTDADAIYDEPGAVRTERVSVYGGPDARRNLDGTTPAISADGRHVAFMSEGSGTEWDPNGNQTDIFVHDRRTQRTALVSVATDGRPALWDASWDPAISAGGRFVAFWSRAPLTADDTDPPFADVFVRDRDTDRDGILDEPGAVRTSRMSISSSGTAGNEDSLRPALSPDGRYVAFETLASNLVPGDTNGKRDIVVRDRLTGGMSRMNVSATGAQGSADAYMASISADGRYVSFTSGASNLVAGDTNGKFDVFVRDRDADADGILDEPGAVSVERASVTTAGAPANGHSISSGLRQNAMVSDNGRYAVFDSSATNLVAGDTNGYSDVFVRDRGTP